jgi:hypothetical protein
LKSRSDFVLILDEISEVRYYIAQMDVAHYLLISEQIVDKKPETKQVTPKSGLFSRATSVSVKPSPTQQVSHGIPNKEEHDKRKYLLESLMLRRYYKYMNKQSPDFF